MGIIRDRFGNRTYANEAEVSQRFVLPLLELLGYALDSEVVPERRFPALTIPLNRTKRGSTKDRWRNPTTCSNFHRRRTTWLSSIARARMKTWTSTTTNELRAASHCRAYADPCAERECLRRTVRRHAAT